MPFTLVPILIVCWFSHSPGHRLGGLQVRDVLDFRHIKITIDSYLNYVLLYIVLTSCHSRRTPLSSTILLPRQRNAKSATSTPLESIHTQRPRSI